MPTLRLCDACSRHVFANEVTCPFCGELLPTAPLGRAVAIRSGMSRAQRFAVAAAVAGQTAIVGCSKTTSSVPVYGISIPIAGAGGGGTGGLSAIPPSGGAGRTGSGQSGAGAPSTGTGGRPSVTPAYGAPVPPRDAGGGNADDDGGVSTPAKDGGPRVIAPYGAPPVPPKK